jgi:hypothetical protein
VFGVCELWSGHRGSTWRPPTAHHRTARSTEEQEQERCISPWPNKEVDKVDAASCAFFYLTKI